MSLLLRDVAAGRVMRGAEGRRVGVKFLLWENGGGLKRALKNPFVSLRGSVSGIDTIGQPILVAGSMDARTHLAPPSNPSGHGNFLPHKDDGTCYSFCSGCGPDWQLPGIHSCSHCTGDAPWCPRSAVWVSVGFWGSLPGVRLEGLFLGPGELEPG